MYAFLFSDNNLWFAISMGIVIALFTIEVLGMVFGLSLMGLVDDISPIELDADADIDGGFSSIFSWLCLDRLPLMIWFVLLLTCFSLTGYTINYAALKVFNFEISSIILIPVAMLVGLVLTGRLGSALARLLPKNESSATHEFEFEGRVAQITLGTAKIGSPAEAKCMDQFEQAHYLMVEPMDAEESFNQHDKVVLVKKGPHSWLAMRYL